MSQSQHIQVSQIQSAPHLSQLTKTHYSLTVKTRNLDAAFDHSLSPTSCPQNMSAFSSYFQLHCESLPNPHMNWESSGAPWSPKLALQTDPGRMGSISHTGLEHTCLLEFCHVLPSSLLLQQHQLPDKRSPSLSHSFSPLASVSAFTLLLSLLLLGPVCFFPLSSSPSFFLPRLSHSAPSPSSPILPFSDDNVLCDNHRKLELGATSLAFLT